MRDIWHALSLSDTILRVIHWPNLCIVVSQGVGRPEKMERDGGTPRWRSRGTHTTFLPSDMGVVSSALEAMTIVTSKITNRGHHNKYNNNEKFEMLWKKVKVRSLSYVRLFATTWTVAHQASLFMESSRQKWEDIPFSRGSSPPRDRIQVSCIAGGLFTIWATWEGY